MERKNVASAICVENWIAQVPGTDGGTRVAPSDGMPSPTPPAKQPGPVEVNENVSGPQVWAEAAGASARRAARIGRACFMATSAATLPRPPTAVDPRRARGGSGDGSAWTPAHRPGGCRTGPEDYPTDAGSAPPAEGPLDEASCLPRRDRRPARLGSGSGRMAGSEPGGTPGARRDPRHGTPPAAADRFRREPRPVGRAGEVRRPDGGDDGVPRRPGLDPGLRGNRRRRGADSRRRDPDDLRGRRAERLRG